MNKEMMTMATIAMIIAVIESGSFLSLANGQSQTGANNATGTVDIASDALVWTQWKDLLKKEIVPFYPITFYKFDDKCGSAADHAKELNMQLRQILKYKKISFGF